MSDKGINKIFSELLIADIELMKNDSNLALNAQELNQLIENVNCFYGKNSSLPFYSFTKDLMISVKPYRAKIAEFKKINSDDVTQDYRLLSIKKNREINLK